MSSSMFYLYAPFFRRRYEALQHVASAIFPIMRGMYAVRRVLCWPKRNPASMFSCQTNLFNSKRSTSCHPLVSININWVENRGVQARIGSLRLRIVRSPCAPANATILFGSETCVVRFYNKERRLEVKLPI